MRNIHLFLLLIFAATNLSAQNINPEKVSLKLLEKMDAEPNAWHSVHVMLADRVDIKALDTELTARRAKKSERAQTVITALRAKADESQGKLSGFLRSHKDVQTESVKGYWIANAIFAEMKSSTIAELSQRSDVEWIGLNGIIMPEKYEKTNAAPPVSPDGIENGLAAIDAPELWAMGYTGYGQRAFTSDTGVDPSHPALESRNYNFYVPKEHTWYEFFNGPHEPFDCDDHGTHVTGTMLGLDRLTNDTIGVAFNANWMGGAILCGVGTADNVGAFQWSLDPDGDPSTTDDMPTVINNSWWDSAMTGQECNSVYVSVLEATEAAGIAVVFSAGNGGPNPTTITAPKNIIIHEVNPFTVGSVNGNNPSFPISNFSSIGPSVCAGDSSLLIKPEVSAPGQSVRSSVPGNGYDFFSGTSMAAPHTSGAIMLLAEAFPDLSAYELKLALYHTCMDLGDPGEDNTFGMGIINVKMAFDSLVAQGHVPVSPYRANDIMMVDMQVSDFACSSGIAPALIAENAGTDTIYSFEIQTQIGGESSVETWTGVLAPRERVSYQVNPLTPSTGIYDVYVQLEMPNGVEDERPLNNNFRREALVINREGFEAQVEGGLATVCEGTTALLRGISPYDNGSLQVNWFEEPLGADPVSSDEAFITPPLNASTTYYAEAVYTVPVGEKDPGVGETFLLDTVDLGMRFEAIITLNLKAVTVHVVETGGRVFSLRNQSGDLVKSSVKFINDVGEVRVPLDWEVEPGIYDLIIQGGKPLVSNSDGADYPYTIDNIFTITRTTDNQGFSGAWYYFYDWEIEFVEPCGRTPITVDVGPSGDAPVASFSPSADVVNVADNTVIDFTNASQNGTTYAWNFGDNNTSDDESPSHTYSLSGEYTVSMVATAADGCSDAALHLIVVEEDDFVLLASDVSPEAENVAVFPNPITDQLTVHVDLATVRSIALRLTDTSGRIVHTEEFDSIQNGQLRLPTADLPEGVYFLLVDMETEASVWKVVKI